MIGWENGELISNRLKIIAADSFVTCTIHVRKTILLVTPESSQFRQSQALIESAQWGVSPDRIDTTISVMTLSGFLITPWSRHLDRTKHICYCLSILKRAIIHFQTDKQAYSVQSNQGLTWMKSVYGKIFEITPTDAPEPLGRLIILTHYINAILHHDWLTGMSVIGTPQLLNKTPIEWFSIRQSAVDIATYCSEFVAAGTCVEQMIDLRTTLQYIGTIFWITSYIFNGNNFVMNNILNSDVKLHKKLMLCFYHIPKKGHPSRFPFLSWKDRTSGFF